MNIDEVIELNNMVSEAAVYYLKAPRPTEQTIQATEAALGFTFPPSFRRFIVQSHYYSFIEPNLNHPSHIVASNSFFHEEGAEHYLPDFLILFMGGGDGDCLCFDSRFRDERGECPVVYWDAEEMREADIKDLEPQYRDFLAFLEWKTDAELKRTKR